MIVRTPLRLSFFGNARANTSALTAAIDKYVYVQLRAMPPIHGYKYRVVWDRLEQTQSAAEIKQPIARAILQHYVPNEDKGYDILAGSDLPAGSGFGARSAFTLSLFHAFFSAQGKTCSKNFLASETIRLQRDLLNQKHGAFDAAASAHGGVNRIEDDHANDVRVTKVNASAARVRQLADRLMLFCAKDASRGQIVEENPEQDTDIVQAAARVDAAQKILESESAELDDFGRLLHEAKLNSPPSSKASESPTDRLYNAALGAGALGGQILGGGRALLLYVASENAAAVQSALPSYTRIPFNFDQDGASIIFQSASAPAASG